MASPKLLTRDQFRESVQARDKHRCVLCGATGVPLDSHHILDRALWADGGYYLDNGATLCDPRCHMLAEQTLVSCEKLRELCGIKRVVLPDQFSDTDVLDKWGNPLLPNGMRMRGELFDAHQDILEPVLHLFTDRVKFPRTYHLPWSAGLTGDDRKLESLDHLIGHECVITEKMDGENTTMTRDYLHARSLSYEAHPSRSWVRALHGQIAHEIPEGMRVCGENLYAVHSIAYENLRSYFQVFAIWDKRNVCLSWDETVEWCALLGLEPVPVLGRGRWDGTQRPP